jgi:fatty-acyl-CoA synthase
VTAIIVPRPNASGGNDAGGGDEAAAALAGEIQHAVRERKGPVHTPKRVIMAESLPLTGLGKLDKKALRAQYAVSPGVPGDGH